jgi:hypothetical protein
MVYLSKAAVLPLYLISDYGSLKAITALLLRGASADNWEERLALSSTMQISSTTSSFSAAFGPSATAALNLLGRLAQAVQMPGGDNAAGRRAARTVTPELIRAALLEMGAAAAEVDVALAIALTQTGLPLTLPSLAQANAALASAPGASPAAYALAKSLSLPTTPDALRAMTAVLTASTTGLSGAASALPERVTAWLGLGLEAGTPPDALARGLREMLLQVGRSTEHRLLHTPQSQMPVTDMRTALLRIAGASSDRAMRQGADGLASLLEGQQMLNQASLTAHAHQEAVPLYFALPMTFDGLPGIAETHLWLRTKKEEEDAEEGAGEDAEILRVTVRLTPPKLGRVQADLTGLLSGILSCRFGAEKLSSMRLISKYTGSLAEALSAAGWETCDVTCFVQTDWPPLYHGGSAFASPRTCVDWHV